MDNFLNSNQVDLTSNGFLESRNICDKLDNDNERYYFEAHREDFKNDQEELKNSYDEIRRNINKKRVQKHEENKLIIIVGGVVGALAAIGAILKLKD